MADGAYDPDDTLLNGQPGDLMVDASGSPVAPPPADSDAPQEQVADATTPSPLVPAQDDTPSPVTLPRRQARGRVERPQDRRPDADAQTIPEGGIQNPVGTPQPQVGAPAVRAGQAAAPAPVGAAPPAVDDLTGTPTPSTAPPRAAAAQPPATAAQPPPAAAAPPGPIDPVTTRIVGGEGSGQNPNSPANGFGQFLPDTWLTMMRRYGARLGVDQRLIDQAQQRGPDGDRARQQLLSMRTSTGDVPGFPPGTNLGTAATEMYRRENVAYLQSHGIQNPTPGMQYMAHFLGADGAVSFLSRLQVNPNLPVDQVVGRRALEANVYRDRQGRPVSSPFYNIDRDGNMTPRTLAQVMQWADGTMAAAPTQVAQAGGGAGVTPAAAGGGVAGAGGAGGPDPYAQMIQQIMQQQGTSAADIRAMLERNRQSANLRAIQQLGLGIMGASSQSSQFPRLAIAQGVAQGGSAALQELGRERTSELQAMQAERQANRDALLGLSYMRPRAVGAGGLYDPATGQTIAPQARPGAHAAPIQIEVNGEQHIGMPVQQADGSWTTQDLGPGTLRSGAGGARQSAVLQLRDAYMHANPGMSEADALNAARSRQAETDTSMRRSALNLAQRARDSSNQPYSSEIQAALTHAYFNFQRTGDFDQLRADVAGAFPQRQPPAPGTIDTLVNGALSLYRSATGQTAPAAPAAAPAAGGAPAPAAAAAPPAAAAPAPATDALTRTPTPAAAAATPQAAPAAGQRPGTLARAPFTPEQAQRRAQARAAIRAQPGREQAIRRQLREQYGIDDTGI
jgi:hypothetical protein